MTQIPHNPNCVQILFLDLIEKIHLLAAGGAGVPLAMPMILSKFL
jgi:hypothetical protein